jgi:hypothetical protein
MGPTMDHQIIRSLLGWTIEASKILDVDAELRKELADVRARIAPNQIGSQGQLQEWLEDVDSPENHHRHFSHMWGVFPGCDIDREAHQNWRRPHSSRSTGEATDRSAGAVPGKSISTPGSVTGKWPTTG